MNKVAGSKPIFHFFCGMLKNIGSFIVAGIGTEIGKTVVSAILVEALEADYWKPVQAGELEFTDSDKIRRYISNSTSFIHPEAYRLIHPMSPHAAAEREGFTIDPSKLILPTSNNKIIVELAGGLMVPLTPTYLNIDFIQDLGLPVVLVSRYYLGSINHTLLSVELLKQRGIQVPGIIFNGDENRDTKTVILSYSELKCLGEIPHLDIIDASIVHELGKVVRLNS